MCSFNNKVKITLKRKLCSNSRSYTILNPAHFVKKKKNKKSVFSMCVTCQGINTMRCWFQKEAMLIL